MGYAINRVVYRFWHCQSAAGRVGYIGKDKRHPSRFNLLTRVKESRCVKLCNALKKYPAEIWNKEILASGFKSDEDLVKSEVYFIRKFDSRRKGYNLTDGGEGLGGFKHSLKTRERIGKSQIGKVVSEETKRKIGAANKGKKRSPAIKKRMSEMMMGNTYTLGYEPTPETRRKISRAMKGRKFSPATLKRMSAAQKGKKISVKQRKQISLALKGKKLSAARRAAISLGHKMWWAKRKAELRKVNGRK